MALATVFFALAVIGSLVAWIWMIVIAFRQQDRLWSTLLIIGFFVPLIGVFAPIVFSITRWQRCKPAAILYFSALALSVLGLVGVLASAKSTIENSPELKAAMAQAKEAREAAKAGRAPAPPAFPAAPAPRQPERIEPAPSSEPTAKPTRPADAKPNPPTAPTPAPAATPAKPAPRPASAPTNAPPATVEAPDRGLPPAQFRLVKLGEPGANSLRSLRVEVVNETVKPLREVKLDLTYLDAHGARLGGWTTIHSGNEPLVGARGTNEFDMTAFFVPQFTDKVKIGVLALVYADGSRWPVPKPLAE